MSLQKKQTTAIHNVTFKIIGLVLVVVGVASVLRGDESALGLGILVGAVMLVAPSVRLSYEISPSRAGFAEAKTQDAYRSPKLGRRRSSDKTPKTCAES
jgi:hypothetical protein